jgi:hypothetical protein
MHAALIPSQLGTWLRPLGYVVVMRLCKQDYARNLLSEKKRTARVADLGSKIKETSGGICGRAAMIVSNSTNARHGMPSDNGAVCVREHARPRSRASERESERASEIFSRVCVCVCVCVRACVCVRVCVCVCMQVN